MTKNFLILSQSNSGSTWISKCLKNCYRLYPKEYFNSLLNPLIQRQLDEVVGNEQEYHKLAVQASKPAFHRMMSMTWLAQSEYNATKENFMVFNIPNIIDYFDKVIIYVRPVEYCFPPERGRVKVWYNKWFRSLQINGKICPDIVYAGGCSTHQTKAVLAWQIINWMLVSSAERFGLPVIEHTKIVEYGRDDLAKYIGEWFDVDEILRTRMKSPVPSEEQKKFADEWSGALDYLRMIQEFKSNQISWMS